MAARVPTLAGPDFALGALHAHFIPQNPRIDDLLRYTADFRFIPRGGGDLTRAELPLQ